MGQRLTGDTTVVSHELQFSSQHTQKSAIIPKEDLAPDVILGAALSTVHTTMTFQYCHGKAVCLACCQI